MTGNEEIIREMMDKVAVRLTESLRDSITRSVEQEIAKHLSTALLEGEFYRRVNDDLQEGLKQIYNEVKAAKGGTVVQHIEADLDPEEIFSETSDQLDAVLRTTEKAAVDIIDIVEKLQDLSSTLDTIVKGFESGGVTKENRQKLKDINSTLSMDLSQIMVTLSFQDLTGQRIKIIINSLRKVEQIVRDVMVSTGLMIKAREEEPEKDINGLREEVQTKASTLQGPQEESDQGSVDDLLASLGMD